MYKTILIIQKVPILPKVVQREQIAQAVYVKMDIAHAKTMDVHV